MNSKILLSLATIAVVGAIAIGGTTAYFSDTETSTGNTISAGTLDLSVNGENPLSSKFTISNAKPGDSGTTNIAVANVGSIDASQLTVVLKNIVDSDGTSTEPEKIAEGNTTTEGNLCANVNITVTESGVTDPWYSGTLSGFTTVVNTGALAHGVTRNFTVGYSIPSTVGNEIQGDICTFDIEVGLAQ